LPRLGGINSDQSDLLSYTFFIYNPEGVSVYEFGNFQKTRILIRLDLQGN
jgi:hypothetical protein